MSNMNNMNNTDPDLTQIVEDPMTDSGLEQQAQPRAFEDEETDKSPVNPPQTNPPLRKRVLPFSSTANTHVANTYKRKKKEPIRSKATCVAMDRVVSSTATTDLTSVSHQTDASAILATTAPAITKSATWRASTTSPLQLPFGMKEMVKSEVAQRAKRDIVHLEKVLSDYHMAMYAISLTTNWKKDLYAEIDKSGSFMGSLAQPQDGLEEKRVLKEALKKTIESYIDEAL